MINVGTVGAYLTLSTTEFHKGIGEALAGLDRLERRTRTTASVFDVLKAALTAAVFPFAPLIAAYSRTGDAGALFSSRTASAMRGAKSSVSGAVSSLGASFGLLGGVLSSAQKSTSAAAGRIASGVLTPLSALRRSAYGAMLEVGSGLISGLEQKRAGVLAKARSIANGVSAVIRAALGIASPSKVTRELGRNTGLGFELGLADCADGIEERARMLASGAGISLEVPEIRAQVSSAPSPQQGFSARTEQQLDRLIRAVEGSDKVLQLDGRTFARLMHEYY